MDDVAETKAEWSFMAEQIMRILFRVAFGVVVVWLCWDQYVISEMTLYLKADLAREQSLSINCNKPAGK